MNFGLVIEKKSCHSVQYVATKDYNSKIIFYHIFNPTLPETFWGHSKSFVKLEIHQNLLNVSKNYPTSTRMSNTKVVKYCLLNTLC